jgi:hypothetical protein
VDVGAEIEAIKERGDPERIFGPRGIEAEGIDPRRAHGDGHPAQPLLEIAAEHPGGEVVEGVSHGLGALLGDGQRVVGGEAGETGEGLFAFHGGDKVAHLRRPPNPPSSPRRERVKCARNRALSGRI